MSDVKKPLQVGDWTIEKIKVYTKIEKGRTVCICHASNKACDNDCPKDVVTRDKYYEWEKTFKRDKYGR